MKAGLWAWKYTTNARTATVGTKMFRYCPTRAKRVHVDGVDAPSEVLGDPITVLLTSCA
jgi:hypothetical protein